MSLGRTRRSADQISVTAQVSREQSTAGNPPMLLPCGHALAKQSLLKIAKNSGRPFKCPYCPMEATPGACRHIFFPDAP